MLSPTSPIFLPIYPLTSFSNIFILTTASVKCISHFIISYLNLRKLLFCSLTLKLSFKFVVFKVILLYSFGNTRKTFKIKADNTNLNVHTTSHKSNKLYVAPRFCHIVKSVVINTIFIQSSYFYLLWYL